MRYGLKELAHPVVRMNAVVSCMRLVLLLVVLGIFCGALPGHAQAQTDNRVYHLGQGDKLRITVFGEDDLSGEFDVGADGDVSMPLIGQIPAVGLSLVDLEDEIVKKLKDGYLLNPQVSVEVLNFRPFYIIGEVNNPGSYPYVSGMTMLNAVALAGGFTYRAEKDHVMLKRTSDQPEESVGLDTKVLPGDIIKVEERFF